MKRLRLASTLLIGVVAGMLTSCATATRGSHTIFKVETVPAGAKVVTDLVYKGDPQDIEGAKPGETIYYGCESTPCGIKLPRRSDFNIMILKEGHQPATTAVFKERNKMQARKTEKTGLGVMATGVAIGGVATASAVAEATLLMPVAGTATGVDLASGALIDLRPNPLQVELKPEVTAQETDELIAAFMNSRRIRNEIP